MKQTGAGPSGAILLAVAATAVILTTVIGSRSFLAWVAGRIGSRGDAVAAQFPRRGRSSLQRGPLRGAARTHVCDPADTHAGQFIGAVVETGVDAAPSVRLHLPPGYIPTRRALNALFAEGVSTRDRLIGEYTYLYESETQPLLTISVQPPELAGYAAVTAARSTEQLELAECIDTTHSARVHVATFTLRDSIGQVRRFVSAYRPLGTLWLQTLGRSFTEADQELHVRVIRGMTVDEAQRSRLPSATPASSSASAP